MNRRRILWVSCLLLVTSTACALSPLKVACVGNSITYGANIANREKNSYPAQLQQFLGPGYEVRNFGVNGRTLLSKGNAPYVQTNEYRQSLAYLPDIVFIKLGTNDSKPVNRVYLQEYKRDYLALIKQYKALASHPRIILLQPVHCFLPEPNDISDSVMQARISPVIREIAYEEHLETIDLYRLFGDTWQQHLFPDHLHPSSIGAGQMAERLAQYLDVKVNKDMSVSLPLPEKGHFNFYGYAGTIYDMQGVECYLVTPHRMALGRPWIWRARFWGHQPQTDIALLEQGFCVAYCDVANLYGAPQAVKRWDKFYQLAVKAGLNKKVVLEGMSRGGLIVYNWAAKHTKDVAAIYVDAPVLDFKSWPMGKGASQSSKEDVEALMKAYGFHSEEEALRWQDNPLDHAARMARSGIPILHVVGDADHTVPVSENTARMAKAFAACGHTLNVIHKPGVDHHPHSLFNPDPIVRFILRATGRYTNISTQAVPGNEYLQAAEWVKGNE